MRPRSQRSGLTLVGRRIAELRRLRGLTQEEFACRIGVSYKYEQQIEYGKANLTLLAFFNVANVLQVPAMTLLDPDAGESKPLGRPPQPRSKAGPYQRSRYLGVHGEWGLWYGRIEHDGVRRRLGPFPTQRAAALAYDAAAKRLKGERARLNFPTE